MFSFISHQHQLWFPSNLHNWISFHKIVKIRGNNSILDLPVNNFFKANEYRSFGPIFILYLYLCILHGGNCTYNYKSCMEYNFLEVRNHREIIFRNKVSGKTNHFIYVMLRYCDISWSLTINQDIKFKIYVSVWKLFVTPQRSYCQLPYWILEVYINS